MNIKRFLKDWSLPLSLVTGAVCYFFGRSLGLSTQAREAILESINYIQPTLIFCMLALTFCRIRLQDMRLKGWQWWLLAFQAGVASLLCLLHETTEDPSSHVFLQSMMLLFLCPTATAAAVVTAKLDGNVGSLAAYTMLINLAAAVLISAYSPLVNPTGGLSFWLSFWMIIRKVFPLLIGPMLAGLIIRRFSPTLLRWLTSIPDLAFYLWLVSSSLAIAVTTRILVHAEVSWLLCLLILIGSLVLHAVCDGSACWQTLRGSRHSRSSLRSEEHGAGHLGRLHVPRSPDLRCWRLLHHLAQRLQRVATLQAKPASQVNSCC